MTVVQERGPEPARLIPASRSKFESSARKVIGGGTLRTWAVDRSMYRGGGSSFDALLLLCQASEVRPGAFLKNKFTLFTARMALGVPGDLEVPDGPEATVMKNFNNEATGGPFLRWMGINKKYGLKELLEKEMWQYYDDYATGNIELKQLPYIAARLGFRTKLLSEEKAKKRLEEGKAFGRAVMMMDAIEQTASSPMYNVLSRYTFERRLEKECGFKNTVIRASTDWSKIWGHVKEAEAIVELDWSKFDRERPEEDLIFMVKVVVSCFKPKNDREIRLLEAYEHMMTAALVHRPIVLDNGTVFKIEGMVPSGSLWTGWIDTALNILYLKAACLSLDIPSSLYVPMCAGDDNLTLFWKDPGSKLDQLRGVLNKDFRAGIDEGDFMVHRPPYAVTKRQAIFPAEVDLRKGTSRLVERARWVTFEGELEVDIDAGKSHRWEYDFRGCPKFLSFYWLGDGRPIRPTRDNLEKLLWPEGVHKSLDDYEAALASMVVDNPWNHHNVNHCLMRYILCKQVRSVCAGWFKTEDCLWFSKIKGQPGEPIPFPQVLPWRKTSPHSRMEDYEEVKAWIEDFQDFISGVTSLYARKATGGVDAYHFMDLIRGESHVGEGQFGNDLRRWLDWLHHHPVTKYFKSARGFRHAEQTATLEPRELAIAKHAFILLREKLYSSAFSSVEEFCLWLVNDCPHL